MLDALSVPRVLDSHIRQNSTNILAKNITCRGGNGVTFGSLGQYVQFVSVISKHMLHDNQTTKNVFQVDIVDDVVLDDLRVRAFVFCPGSITLFTRPADG